MFGIDYCFYCKKEIRGTLIGSEYTRDWLGRVYHEYPCMDLAEKADPSLITDAKIYRQWLRGREYIDDKRIKDSTPLPEHIRIKLDEVDKHDRRKAEPINRNLQ